uniref:DNA-directed RNA polymerase n=1 Tax=Haematococcus lacustris TaxID=44745 RepID=A0A2K9YS03_HAELA|nr:DNA-directed RNA polymerase [Haematococcus lacustris]AUW36547.1 DNA-directed RNA polymerase [Haematococcus lacustris]
MLRCPRSSPPSGQRAPGQRGGNRRTAFHPKTGKTFKTNKSPNIEQETADFLIRTKSPLPIKLNKNNGADVVQKLQVSNPFLTKNETIYEAWTWGYIWILSGKIYESNKPTPFFIQKGDFLNLKSCISLTNWKLSNKKGKTYHIDFCNILSGKYLSNSRTSVGTPFFESRTLLDTAHQTGVVGLTHPKVVGGLSQSTFFRDGIGSCGESAFQDSNSNSNSNKSSLSEKGEKKTSTFEKLERPKLNNLKILRKQPTICFDLNKILYKEYGYLLILPEKVQFLKSLRILPKHFNIPENLKLNRESRGLDGRPRPSRGLVGHYYKSKVGGSSGRRALAGFLRGPLSEAAPPKEKNPGH